MERDMELVKEILAQLRDGNYHVEEEIDWHSEEEIIYHLKIMEENDLVDAELNEVAHRGAEEEKVGCRQNRSDVEGTRVSRRR